MDALISKINQSSNGVVATVKTYHGTNAAASSSSSAPSSRPVTVAAEELHDWSLSSQEGVPPINYQNRYHFIDDLPDLINTHVNASEVLMAGGKTGGTRGRGSRSKGKRELSRTYGDVIPWLKVPSTRNVEIHTVELIDSQIFIVSSTVGPAFTAMAFTVAAVPEFSSFSAVFDQYRISLIEAIIEPQITEVLSVATAVGIYVTAVDVDDANSPTALNGLDGYTDVQSSRGTISHYHRWVPSVAVAVYSGAFTSFASTTSMWLDCGSPNIQHYGLKAITGTSTQAQSYKLTYKLHVSWRARH